MGLDNHRYPLWIRLSVWLAIVLFRPVLYVMVGATIGLGLLAAAVGADPPAVMAGFITDATVEVTPLVKHLVAIWAVFTALAALISATVGEIRRLPVADKRRIGYLLLGRVHERPLPLSACTTRLRQNVLTRLIAWRRKWTAGINPSLVYE